MLYTPVQGFFNALNLCGINARVIISIHLVAC